MPRAAPADAATAAAADDDDGAPAAVPHHAGAGFAAVIALIGPGPAFRLCEAHAGTTVAVPSVALPGSPLARLVGLAAARALAGSHGGCALAVPLLKRWRAVVYARHGVARRDIARRLGMDESGVNKYLRWAERAGVAARPAAGPAGGAPS